ncbi:hypothetical protein [Sphingomonas paeninsulae]|uniref:hypothetical protein n=1 Tax=Sphingomonas paeninsulae TaxID=2319844 RepID=UPI0013CEE75D|nr:hypothetical protein [Sphingomonas paeninsulae]
MNDETAKLPAETRKLVAETKIVTFAPLAQIGLGIAAFVTALIGAGAVLAGLCFPH